MDSDDDYEVVSYPSSSSLNFPPPSDESAMPRGRKSGPAAELSAEFTPPSLIPLYLQHISVQLGRPPPPKDSEEYYSLLADLRIATYRKDWTQSLDLFPPADHRKLSDLEKFFTSCPYPAPPTINPYENLQQYASKARLPPMPWSTDLGKVPDPGPTLASGISRRTATHTKGSSTVVTPDSARKLRSVLQIPTKQFFQRVLAFSKSHLPSSQCVDPLTNMPILGDPLDRSTFGVSVPHPEFHVSDSVRPPPNSETDVQTFWVMSVACKTAERILHVHDNTRKEWEFRTIRGPGTQQMQADYVWSKSPEGTGARLAIEVKTPWTFLPADFKEFVGLVNGIPLISDLEARSKLDSSMEAASGKTQTTKGSKPTFTKAENLMAQTYDYCVRQGHHWFIVTTYERWVFGVFSLDYSSAEVTDVLEYNCAEPTILECILFWTQSSMYVPSLWEIPRLVNDNGIIRKQPDVWRDALDHWSSQGFVELEKAILQRQKTWDKPSTPRPAEPFVQQYWNDISTRWKSARTDLKKSVKGRAVLRAQEVLNLLLSQDHIDWSVRLTWLALLQCPAKLSPDLTSLTECYVKQAWALKEEEAVHPLSGEPLDHPLLRDKDFREVQKLIMKLLRDSMREPPTIFQDKYNPANLPDPETDFAAAIGKLVSREIFLVLTNFLSSETTQLLRQAMIDDGLLKLDQPRIPSSPARDTQDEDTGYRALLGLEDGSLPNPPTPGPPPDSQHTEWVPWVGWSAPPTTPSPAFKHLFEPSSGNPPVTKSRNTDMSGLKSEQNGGKPLPTRALRETPAQVPRTHSELPTPQPTPLRKATKDLTDMEISSDELDPRHSKGPKTPSEPARRGKEMKKSPLVPTDGRPRESRPGQMKPRSLPAGPDRGQPGPSATSRRIPPEKESASRPRSGGEPTSRPRLPGTPAQVARAPKVRKRETVDSSSDETSRVQPREKSGKPPNQKRRIDELGIPSKPSS